MTRLLAVLVAALALLVPRLLLPVCRAINAAVGWWQRAAGVGWMIGGDE